MSTALSLLLKVIDDGLFSWRCLLAKSDIGHTIVVRGGVELAVFASPGRGD